MILLTSNGVLTRRCNHSKSTMFSVYYYLGNIVQRPRLDLPLCRNLSDGIVSLQIFLFFKWFIVVVMVDVIEDVLCHVYVQLPANPPVLLNCLAIRIWLIVVTNVLAFYMKLSLLSKFLLILKLLVILFTIMPFCILIVWLNWLIVRISLSMLLSIKIIVLMLLLFLLLVQFH